MDKLTWKIDKLRNWDKNPRNIQKADFERGKRQLIRNKEITGEWLFEPLVITPDGEVLGGNMRLRALHDLKVEDVWVNVVNPKTEAEKLEIALAANDRWGSYVEQDLAELLTKWQDDIKLGDYKVDLGTPIDLAALLDKYQPTEEDEAPEVDEENEPDSKLGEVYELGRHRLMCGDSTKVEDVEKLMDGQKADLAITDPPYGVNYVGKTKDALTIDNDLDNDREGMKEFWITAFCEMREVMKDGASYYCFSSQGGEMMMMMMMMALDESGLAIKQQIIWRKNTIVLGHYDYQFQHEPIFYGWKRDSNHQFYGDRTQSSVWDFDKPAKSELHPTMKPLGILCKAIKNSSKEGDIVLDLFGGSGSTLIACEQTNRTCYMMEIDPRYSDVIRKRYDNFIAKKDIQ